MNLFRVSENPIKCAVSLDNSRVGKILMETTQLLSNAIHYHTDHKSMDFTGPGRLTIPSHWNHSLSIWIRSCQNGFDWTLEYGKCLSVEYYYRFDRHHGAAPRLREIEQWGIPLP